MANTYETLPGQMVGSGLNSLVDLANRYKDNPEIAGLTAGSLADAYRTQTNTGLSLQYNDAYLGSLGKYQEALETLRKGNTMELMGQEGAITERLAGQQISGQKDIAGIQADTTKYGYDKDFQGIQTQVAGQKDVAGIQADATKYGYDTQERAARYSADADVKKADITSERGLEGIKYGADSEERRIGLQGKEDRETVREKYAQETESQIKLRTDARGAIAKAGSRFYG